MSAIYGIVYKGIQRTDVVGDAHKIAVALKHRATNCQGQWQGEQILLGFGSLATSVGQGDASLLYEDSRFVVVADSLLFRKQQLAAKLGIDTSGFSDSRLILEAYHKWQRRCVDHLEGEFAFAIWDKNAKQLFLVTDHIGFRPLYYYESDKMFVFSSELKGILSVKPPPHYFNEASLVEYQFRHGDPLQTFDRDIKALGGATLVTVTATTTTIDRYWTLSTSGKYRFANDEDWIACLSELFREAVVNRLATEFPVGVTLSGGLDSSAVASVLAPILAGKNKPLYCFSSVLPEGHIGPERDERKFIEIVGNTHPNIIQTYVDAPGAGPFKAVPEAFEDDETFPNVFFYMDRAILEAAQQKNVRMLFSGFGGDYAVSHKGNTVIYQLIMQGRYVEALRIAVKMAHVRNENVAKVLRTDVAAHLSIYRTISQFVNRRKPNKLSHSVLKKALLNRYTQNVNIKPPTDNKDFLSQHVADGNIARTLGMFANRNEKFGMGAATPFFDKDLLEFIMDAPLHLLVKTGHHRSMFRLAMEGILPEEIQWRTDKLPYSPFFQKRVFASVAELEAILGSIPDPITGALIDKTVIAGFIDEVKALQQQGGVEQLRGIRIAQAGIMALVINLLLQKKYFFE